MLLAPLVHFFCARAGHIAELGETHTLPLKSVYNAQRGWHVQLPWKGPVTDLPPVFEQVVVKGRKKIASMSTKDLRRMNSRIQENLADIYMLTDGVISQALADARGNLGCLYKLSDAVAMLDMLRSFAELTIGGDDMFCRPTFGTSLALKQAKHPILFQHARASTVGNDTYVCDATKMNIIQVPVAVAGALHVRPVPRRARVGGCTE